MAAYAGALASAGVMSPQDVATQIREPGSLTVRLDAPKSYHDGHKKKDEKLLAMTIWGEARNQGDAGMRAIGHVIMNRVAADKKRFGKGVKGVVWKPKQFSCWNRGDPNREAMQNPQAMNYPDRKSWERAKEIAHEILSGQSRDPTRGSLYYHTQAVNPEWASEMRPVRVMADHVFYRS